METLSYAYIEMTISKGIYIYIYTHTHTHTYTHSLVHT